MKSLVVLFLVFSPFLATLNASCEYEAEELSVGWVAYKTAAKAGVKGSFDDIELEGGEAESFVAMLIGLEAEIETESVNTKNEGRDETLVKSFFRHFTSDEIKAKVIDVKGDDKSGVMTVRLKMNGVNKELPLRYEVSGTSVKANGHIDLFDFSLNKALASINKACYDLHGGKTWNDVAINMELTVEKSCK